MKVQAYFNATCDSIGGAEKTQVRNEIIDMLQDANLCAEGFPFGLCDPTNIRVNCNQGTRTKRQAVDDSVVVSLETKSPVL